MNQFMNYEQPEIESKAHEQDTGPFSDEAAARNREEIADRERDFAMQASNRSRVESGPDADISKVLEMRKVIEETFGMSIEKIVANLEFDRDRLPEILNLDVATNDHDKKIDFTILRKYRNDFLNALRQFKDIDSFSNQEGIRNIKTNLTSVTFVLSAIYNKISYIFSHPVLPEFFLKLGGKTFTKESIEPLLTKLQDIILEFKVGHKLEKPETVV